MSMEMKIYYMDNTKLIHMKLMCQLSQGYLNWIESCVDFCNPTTKKCARPIRMVWRISKWDLQSSILSWQAYEYNTSFYINNTFILNDQMYFVVQNRKCCIYDNKPRYLVQIQISLTIMMTVITLIESGLWLIDDNQQPHVRIHLS